MEWRKGREGREEGDVCIIMADLHCCEAETNTTLQKLKTKKGKNSTVFRISKRCFYSPVNMTISSVQFSHSVMSALCNLMNRSTPGLPVHHQQPELDQTHVHKIGDAIQPSCPLPSPSLPAFNLSQHQGLFQWVSSLHPVAKVLELQHQPFQWIFRVDFLWDWLVWSPCCPRDSQESSSALQFGGINSSALCLL